MSQTQFLKQITFLFLFSLLAFLCTNSKKLRSKKDPISDFLNNKPAYISSSNLAKQSALESVKNAAWEKWATTFTDADHTAYIKARDAYNDFKFNIEMSALMAQVFGQANSILAGSSFIEEGHKQNKDKLSIK